MSSRRGARTLGLLALATAITLAHGALTATATTTVSPTDAAATETYLAAWSTYVSAQIAAEPQAHANAEALVSRLGAECPQVLRGTPPTRFPTHWLRESIRAERQRHDLEGELSLTLYAAYAQLDLQPALAFADAASQLQWSDAGLSEAVHAKARAEQQRAQAQPADVCADVRWWIQSGYRTLSPASTTLLEAHAGERKRPGAALPEVAHALARYETPTQRALQRHIAQLERSLDVALIRAFAAAHERLESLLGAHEDLEARPQAPATVLGHGATVASGGFAIKRESTPQDGCKLSLAIEADGLGRGRAGGAVSEGGVCLSTRYLGAHQGVQCNQGLLTVISYLPPTVPSVTLTLSDGRRISSGAIRYPRLGGRQGFYYQVVRGPSPIPVTLSDQDAAGRTLRVIALPTVVGCTEPPLKYLAGGHPRTLASGAPMKGLRFVIRAERYSFLGHVHFKLRAQIRSEAEASGLSGSSLFIVIATRHRPLEAPPFKLEEASGCHPHLYDVLFGVLKPPGASVLVRDAKGLTTLHQTAIPRAMDAGGRLAYGALPAPALELIVRDAHGQTIFTEVLTARAEALSEQCEGEAEAPLGGEADELEAL